MSPGRPRGFPLPEPVWHDPPHVADEAVRALAGALSLPEVLARLLIVRGVSTPEAARAHLRPRVEHLGAPGDYLDVDRAAARIEQAIDAGEVILVHGDFDADGLCATALLTRWLRRLGARVQPFIPHRTEHGYDLGAAGLGAAREAGARLIITVDCGIVAFGAAREVADADIDLIVTDHHTPGSSLPQAHAVVHPQRASVEGADASLCGAGIAFKLVQHLAARAGIGIEEVLADLDLVAIATIADLVPLTGDNRVLVRYGLRALEQTRSVGLIALMAAAGVEAPLDAGQVAYRLAPRLNAVGRMGSAQTALQLLLTEDPAEAQRLVELAEQLNQERRTHDRRASDQALEMLADADPAETWGIVLAHEAWHPGVLGIAASRVREQTGRPTVLVSLDGDLGRGSGRSVPAVHLHEALQRCADHLAAFGGHSQAAGLQVERAQLAAFRAAFNTEARRQLEGRDLRPEWRPDAQFNLRDASLETVRLLSYLGPHGAANPGPLLLARGVRVTGRPRVVGQAHLKLDLADGSTRVPAIGFGLAERIAAPSLDGAQVDALFELEVNHWRGRSEVQLRLRDLRPHAPAAEGSGAVSSRHE